jgi:hypothetical protein
MWGSSVVNVLWLPLRRPNDVQSFISTATAHSPHLNPTYFYLWEYLKDSVYENNPQIIGELKAAITAKIREIP